MDNFQIETAQNVSIEQNIAGIGDRILAYLIDSLIMVVYVLLIVMIMAGLGLEPGSQWFFWMIMGLPIFLYYLLWETLWDGKTPGKYAMKIRVVRLDGSRPSFSNYLVRWLLRIIDISLASGGVAIVTILFTGRGQRLGDLAAGTAVVSEKQKVKFSDTLLVDIPENYVPKYPQVTVFTDAEMGNVKTIYMDAKRNSNHGIIINLSEKVSSVMGIIPKEEPLNFVAKVIEDYNYFTQKI